MLKQRLTNVDTLLEDGDHLLQLANGCRNRGQLGLLLRLLTVKRGQFGAMLGASTMLLSSLLSFSRITWIQAAIVVGTGLWRAARTRGLWVSA